jgi:hypothetical protein
MQIHLHEGKILQIHNARPEFVKKISRLLTNQNPAFLYKVQLILKNFIFHKNLGKKYVAMATMIKCVSKVLKFKVYSTYIIEVISTRNLKAYSL